MFKRGYVFFTLIINGLVPWGLYVWLSQSMSGVAALSIATLVPLADNLLYVAKHRKLDVFGSTMLFTFGLTLALVLMGGSEKILLIRESLVTAGVGVIFLGSLLFRRPLIFYLATRFIGNKELPANWTYSYFRFVMRLMTFVWGMMLVAESIVRVIMVYEMPTEQYLAWSNVVLYGFIGATVLWTIIYRRYSARKLGLIKTAANRGGMA